jgi:hypothetical protein
MGRSRFYNIFNALPFKNNCYLFRANLTPLDYVFSIIADPDPGSGIGFFWIPDPKPMFKNKIIFNFVIFVTTKKVGPLIFFHPSLFLLFLDLGSEIRDQGYGMDKNQDPESGINIPDPQQCFFRVFWNNFSCFFLLRAAGRCFPVT